MPSMPEQPKDPRPVTPLGSLLEPAKCDKNPHDQMLCERCGAEMYRMHAVWRCPGCGFKTDCCGW